MIDRLVDYFVTEVGYGRSIDWYLVKLSSVVSSINDLCRGGVCDPRELFTEFLSNERVRRALSSLACYRGEVVEMIKSSPRFRNLRNFLDLIENALSSIECISKKELEYIPRPATWVIESREREAVAPKPVVKREHRLRMPSSGLERTIFIVSIVLFIIVVLVLILHLVR